MHRKSAAPGDDIANNAKITDYASQFVRLACLLCHPALFRDCVISIAGNCNTSKGDYILSDPGSDLDYKVKKVIYVAIDQLKNPDHRHAKSVVQTYSLWNQRTYLNCTRYSTTYVSRGSRSALLLSADHGDGQKKRLAHGSSCCGCSQGPDAGILDFQTPKHRDRNSPLQQKLPLHRNR